MKNFIKYLIAVLTTILLVSCGGGGSSPQPPSAVNISTISLVNNTTQDVSFTGAATDPGNLSLTYFWDFGDGTSIDQNPTHQFESDTGYFDVTFIADFRGCKDTFTVENAVYILAPIAQYPFQTQRTVDAVARDKRKNQQRKRQKRISQKKKI